MAASGSRSIRQNLQQILERISAVYDAAPPGQRARKCPRLVAVSKTKPNESIIEAYEAGQRHFGENYVQELEQKSTDPEILAKCPDIQWHFIGHCQSTNAKKLTKCTNLSCIETVSSEKLAAKLQSQFSKKNPPMVVDVMVQVNTSGEENKNGVKPEESVKMVKFVVEKCPNLKFVGLMTIGAIGYSLGNDDGTGSNPDFLSLIECREKVAETLDVDPKSLELSIGMSNDYQEAIKLGSTNVRVGSSIFGARNYPAKKDPVEIATKELLKKAIK